MRYMLAAVLAGLLGAAGITTASAQQYPYPNGSNGQYGTYGQYPQQGRAGRCNSNYRYNNANRRDDDDNDGDNDRGDRDGQARYNQGNGNGHGWGNARRCANNGNGNAMIRGMIVGVNGNQVTINQAANGQYGQYGQYGQFGQYGQYGSGQYGPIVRIDDQPALDAQQTGRVAIGRYVTAYGYWRNGVFYATRLV